MIQFKLKEGVNLPSYESDQAVGLDVTANSILEVFKGNTETKGEKLERIKEGFEQRGFINLRSLERILFGTGIYAQLPENIELQVRSRSGIALKRGLICANQPGTIDPDYRGEIGIILFNSTPFLNRVEKGERIAQLVPKEIIRPAILQVQKVNTDTERGNNGFGSTGKEVNSGDSKRNNQVSEHFRDTLSSFTDW